MNYFELFEIPVKLIVDKAMLPNIYFKLSRKYHPDFYVNASEEDKIISLEKTALLNKAFKTFQQPDETIKYVLTLKGLLTEEENYQLPAGFLTEILEINELLMDKAGEPGLASRIAQLQTEIYEPVKEIMEGYQEGITSEKELLQVKEYYYKKKYIDRIMKELEG